MAATSSTNQEVRQRWDRAMARSRALCSRSGHLVAVSRQARVSAERTRVECVTLRGGADTPLTGEDVQNFVVQGVVDGRPATARFVDGQLFCTAEVARRAEVVVAIGETFDPGDGGPVLQASLDDTATAALLTVMRAFSQVTSVELGLGRPIPDG